MKAAFRKSFVRDLKKINDRDVLDRVRSAIEDVEAAAELRQITGLKKIAAPGSFYRIRVGEYRVGLAIEGDTAHSTSAGGS